MSKNNGNGHDDSPNAEAEVKELLESVNRNSFDGAFHSDAGFNAVKTMVEPKSTINESAFLLDLEDPQMPQAISWQLEVFEKYGLKGKINSLGLNINLRSSTKGKRVERFIEAIIGERRNDFIKNQNSFSDKVKKFSNFGDGENK
jgi:hypothetical protein